jgi:hypothetical protein
MRAAYRSRKQRDGVWFCGVCAEVVDVETISARQWEKLQNGEIVAANCENCRGRLQRIPASELTCPRCDTLITSSVFAGQVNYHVDNDGIPCTYKFRFRDGVVWTPGNVQWLQECVDCQQDLSRAEYSKTQLQSKTVEARRCMACATTALREATDPARQRKPDQISCKFHVSCSGRVDISHETSDRRKKLRSARAGALCVMCTVQGRCTKKHERMLRCSAAKSCIQCRRAGRVQAESRFPRDTQAGETSHRTCLLCGGEHTLCARCYALVDTSKATKFERYDLRNERTKRLCGDCEKQGYTTRDLRTYTCASFQKCKTAGGRELFEAKSLDNCTQRQREPSCLKCDRAARAKKK